MAQQAKALITRDLNLSSIPRLHNPDFIKLPSDLLRSIHHIHTEAHTSSTYAHRHTNIYSLITGHLKGKK